MALFNNLSRTLRGKALPATIYMIVALAYFISNSLGINIKIVRSIYSIYYLLSFYYVIKAHIYGCIPKYIKALDVFLIVILVYVLVDVLMHGIQPVGTAGNLDFLLWHVQSTVPIYAFFYFGKRDMLSFEWYQFFWVFCIVAIYFAFMSSQKHWEDIILNQTEFTNNVGYSVVCLLPMTLFIKKGNLLKYACIGLISIFTILSFKRGAVLCLVLSLLFVLYSEIISGRKMSNLKRVSSFLFIIAGMVLLYLFVDKLYQSSDYFVERVQRTIDGDSSGRDRIYSQYWQFYKSSNLSKHIFGHGVLATRKFMGTEAHNDWLEYIIDIGLFGLLFYVVYWVVFIKTYFKSRKICGDDINLALGVIIIIYFIRSFISMSFYGMEFYSNIVLGYCIANMNIKKIQN